MAKSGEFSKTRNVNTFSGGRQSSGPNQGVKGSAVKQPAFNGSNVYGISAKGSSGGAANAGRGNKQFGSGSAKAAKMKKAGRGR